MKFFVIIFLCVISTCPSLVLGMPGFGVLTANLPDNGGGTNFCLKYYPALYNMTEHDHSHLFMFENFIYIPTLNSCDPDDPNLNSDLKDKLVMVTIEEEGNENFENCTIKERAQILAKHKVAGIMTDSPSRRISNVSDYAEDIIVVSLYQRKDRDSLVDLMAQYPKGTFYLYAPEDDPKSFDSSLGVILLMAVFTVAFGSAWSGYAKKNLMEAMNDNQVVVGSNEQEEIDGNVDVNHSHGEEEEERIYAHKESNRITEEVSLRITPLVVLGFVCCMCTLLVLLYFFYDQLVYVILTMFCLASFTALYSCFEPLVMLSYTVFPKCPIYNMPKIKCCGGKFRMELRQFILACFSLSVTIVWAIFRKASWAWILQDILGIFFSINMLKTLRLPSLKIITVLLCTLFVYDIFFVFVTPLFTKNGKSVMVEVATGGSTDEQLPMVLKVPHFNSHPLLCCFESYSMLGFGDILVPGLLVSYCHGFDLQKGTGVWTYWLLANFCYMVGMVVTFISLFVMHSAQPALLYLVPFTLIPLYILALIKGDFYALWHGDYKQQHLNDVNSINSADNQRGESANQTDNYVVEATAQAKDDESLE